MLNFEIKTFTLSIPLIVLFWLHFVVKNRHNQSPLAQPQTPRSIGNVMTLGWRQYLRNPSQGFSYATGSHVKRRHCEYVAGSSVCVTNIRNATRLCEMSAIWIMSYFGKLIHDTLKAIEITMNTNLILSRPIFISRLNPLRRWIKNFQYAL